ncbi:MAG: hypothetical protein SWY16_09090 [Cyanobacteriota bacterium]|nr:hypothetical protein [Cyanobacteriota bacterium]
MDRTVSGEGGERGTGNGEWSAPIASQESTLVLSSSLSNFWTV